jgi:hypothetical protein
VLVVDVRRAGAATFLILAATAQAETRPPDADAYPTARVDRPLVMFPGMTAIDFGIDLPTYNETTTDAMGVTHTSRSTLGEHANGDLVVSHSFGGIEGRARVLFPASFDYFALSAEAQPFSESSSLSLEVGFRRDSARPYSVTERASFTQRLVRVPGRFALHGVGGITASEYSAKDATGMEISGRDLSATAQAAVLVQALPGLALQLNPLVTVPIASSGTRPSTTMGIVAQVMLTVQRWDFYAQFILSDVVDERRQYAAAGAVVRF